MHFVVLDTETTGLNRKYSALNEPCSLRDNGDEVIQIGGLLLDERLRPYKAFCHYCDCLMASVPEEASRVHGINIQDVRRYIPGTFLEEVVAEWVPELLSDDVVVIGYNSDFDMQMVAQSMRNFCFDFGKFKKVMTKLPTTGQWSLDVMGYLPKRVKLVSLYDECTEARCDFYQEFRGRLPLESNVPEMLEATWAHAHNSLFDAIETYLVFKTKVLGKKLFRGR